MVACIFPSVNYLLIWKKQFPFGTKRQNIQLISSWSAPRQPTEMCQKSLSLYRLAHLLRQWPHFPKCSLNGAYMARENANSVQRKPSLSLLYDPVWLKCNGPIWSVWQGSEKVRDRARASERWRPSTWEGFQSALRRLKTLHMSSQLVPTQLVHTIHYFHSLDLSFLCLSIVSSVGAGGVSVTFRPSQKPSDSLSRWCNSSHSAVRLMAVQAIHRTGFSWTRARKSSLMWQIRKSTTALSYKQVRW